MEMPEGIFYHVKLKNSGLPVPLPIPEVEDLYKYHPKDLPEGFQIMEDDPPEISGRGGYRINRRASELKELQDCIKKIEDEVSVTRGYHNRAASDLKKLQDSVAALGEYRIDRTGSKLKELLGQVSAAFGQYFNRWYFSKRYNVTQAVLDAVAASYWKPTSSDMEIKDKNNNLLGYKRSFRFMEKDGKKPTHWFMEEFRELKSEDSIDPWVLCKVYQEGSNRGTQSSTSIQAIPKRGITGATEQRILSEMQMASGESLSSGGENGGMELQFVMRKNFGLRLPIHIPEVDFYEYHPKDLPGGCILNSSNNVTCYFAKKEITIRLANGGFWKVVHTEGKIVNGNKKVTSYHRTLIFFEMKGQKLQTNWMMDEYEYRDHDLALDASTSTKSNFFVLCKIYKRETKLSTNSHTSIQPIINNGITSPIHEAGEAFISLNQSVPSTSHPHQTSLLLQTQYHGRNLQHNLSGHIGNFHEVRESTIPRNQSISISSHPLQTCSLVVSTNQLQTQSYGCNLQHNLSTEGGLGICPGSIGNLLDYDNNGARGRSIPHNEILSTMSVASHPLQPCSSVPNINQLQTQSYVNNHQHNLSTNGLDIRSTRGIGNFHELQTHSYGIAVQHNLSTEGCLRMRPESIGNLLDYDNNGARGCSIPHNDMMSTMSVASHPLLPCSLVPNINQLQTQSYASNLQHNLSTNGLDIRSIGGIGNFQGLQIQSYGNNLQHNLSTEGGLGMRPGSIGNLLDYDNDGARGSSIPHNEIMSTMSVASHSLLPCSLVPNINQLQTQSCASNLQHNQFTAEGIGISPTGSIGNFLDFSMIQEMLDNDDNEVRGSSVSQNQNMSTASQQSSSLLPNVNEFQTQYYDSDLEHNPYTEEVLGMSRTWDIDNFHEFSFSQELLDYDDDDPLRYLNVPDGEEMQLDSLWDP